MDVDKLAGVERVTGLGLLEKHQCPWVTGGGGGGGGGLLFAVI